MQNIDILENYPKHMPLKCNSIFMPYDQVFTEFPYTHTGKNLVVYLKTKSILLSFVINFFLLSGKSGKATLPCKAHTC